MRRGRPRFRRSRLAPAPDPLSRAAVAARLRLIVEWLLEGDVDTAAAAVDQLADELEAAA
jgi:hypothetical protein